MTAEEYMELVDVEELDLLKAEALLAPPNFSYSGKLPLFKSWSLGPVICTRDSEAQALANAAHIEKVFEDKFGPSADPGEEKPTSPWAVQHMEHFGHGWSRHLSFQVVTEDGSPSDAFCLIMGLNAAIQDNMGILADVEQDE